MSTKKKGVFVTGYDEVFEFSDALYDLCENVKTYVYTLMNKYKTISGFDGQVIFDLLDDILTAFRTYRMHMCVDVDALEDMYIKLKNEIEKYKTKIPVGLNNKFCDTTEIEKVFYKYTHDEPPIIIDNEITDKDILIKKPVDLYRINNVCSLIYISFGLDKQCTDKEFKQKLDAFYSVYNAKKSDYRTKVISVNALQKTYEDLMSVVSQETKQIYSDIITEMENMVSVYRNNKMLEVWLTEQQPQKTQTNTDDSDIITDQEEIKFLADLCDGMIEDINTYCNIWNIDLQFGCYNPKFLHCLMYKYKDIVTDDNHEDLHKDVLVDTVSINEFIKSYTALKEYIGAELFRKILYSKHCGDNIRKMEDFLNKYKHFTKDSDHKRNKICPFYKLLVDPISETVLMGGTNRFRKELNSFAWCVHKCKGQR